MDDLAYTLRVLCQRNRDGSHATQADRLRTLTLASRQLREAGFRQMRAGSLKGKHVQALLRRWQDEGLSAGTLIAGEGEEGDRWPRLRISRRQRGQGRGIHCPRDIRSLRRRRELLDDRC